MSGGNYRVCYCLSVFNWAQPRKKRCNSQAFPVSFQLTWNSGPRLGAQPCTPPYLVALLLALMRYWFGDMHAECRDDGELASPITWAVTAQEPAPHRTDRLMALGDRKNSARCKLPRQFDLPKPVTTEYPKLRPTLFRVSTTQLGCKFALRTAKTSLISSADARSTAPLDTSFSDHNQDLDGS